MTEGEKEPEEAVRGPAEKEPAEAAGAEPAQASNDDLEESDEAGQPPLDLLAELDAILELGRRAPGSDAERRTAVHLERRLGALGRDAETQSFSIHPAWPLAYALLAAASVGASVLSVSVPEAGAALALGAALLTFLDAGVLLPVARPLFGRRASQNLVSWGDAPRQNAGAIVLVAHTDAGRAGFAQTDRSARRRAALGRLVRRPVAGLQLLFWAQLAVLSFALLRLAGLDGTAFTLAQFLPTLVLIVAAALLTDVALAGTKAGENDNASGCVLALALTERFGDPDALEHFHLHVLYTGAQKAGAAGMRAFVKRHRLAPDRTVVLNLDQVGSGAVRYTRREGVLFTQRSHPQLTALCDQIAEDYETDGPTAITSRSPSDAYAAGALGLPSLTITCQDRLDYASGRVEERVLEQAEGFCAELIERLDAELGPSLVSAADATALSEPEAR